MNMSRKISPTEQVCMNAMHELAQTKMISRISVQDILAVTGISKATFYRHFTDKYDLYDKMLRRDVEYLFNDNCDLNQWTDRIVEHLRNMKKDESIHIRMVRSDPSSFTTFHTNLLSGLLNSRLRRLHGPDYTAPKALQTRCLFISAGLAAILCEWFQEGCPTTPEAMAEEFIRLISTVSKGTELAQVQKD